MAFDTEIQALAGTATQTEMDQWMADGAKEIIHVLPPKLKAKCSTVSTLNNSATTLDVDSKGDILHVTRLSANSGGYQLACREILPMYGGSATDSGNMMHYASATDPVYWIDSSSGVSTLKVKPDPEATQVSLVHHITYPSVDASDVSTIANFPDEAEYLVVLYASIKVLHNKMNEMNSNTDITTAFTYAKAGLDQAETALDKFTAVDTDSVFGDEDTFETATSSITGARNALVKAQSLIDEGTIEGDTDPQSAQYWLNDEDTEMVSATISVARNEISRAEAEISHWIAIGDMVSKEAQSALQEATGYLAEVESRMTRDSQRYQWYQAQQLKLQQDYDKGLQMLTSGGIPVQNTKKQAE